MSDLPNPFGISEEEKERAIQYLMKVYPRKTLKDVYEVNKKDSMWVYSAHFDFGMGVRNTLREGGFEFGDIALDNYWADLIIEASFRVVKNKNPP